MWICCKCQKVSDEFPSNGFCGRCGNEDDFEEVDEYCEFCMGQVSDREFFINSIEPAFATFITSNNEITTRLVQIDRVKHSTKVSIENYPIKYCPICGRKFNTENSK